MNKASSTNQEFKNAVFKKLTSCDRYHYHLKYEEMKTERYIICLVSNSLVEPN